MNIILMIFAALVLGPLSFQLMLASDTTTGGGMRKSNMIWIVIAVCIILVALYRTYKTKSRDP